jgi:hypothetical protein
MKPASEDVAADARKLSAALLEFARAIECRKVQRDAPAPAPRPHKRKRLSAPRPEAAVIVEREELWSKYLTLEMSRGRNKVNLSKLAFAVRHQGINPGEFTRWLSDTDARGIPVGSGPDRLFRKTLTDAISELEAKVPKSHGKVQTYQSSAAVTE